MKGNDIFIILIIVGGGKEGGGMGETSADKVEFRWVAPGGCTGSILDSKFLFDW